MVEEVLPNLYKIEVPLPKNPLKALNSYVIKAPERNMIIDTGLNHEKCKSVLCSGLRVLGVDFEKTDFFITHLHADHMGLVASLVSETSKIYFNRLDAELISCGGRWDDMRNFICKNGFPENELKEVFENHPGYKYGATGQLDFHIVKEGDVINIGNYLFRCVETPGHTRGHMCLYEPTKKILISGDHILYDITPNISLWSDGENPLNNYLMSLGKIYELDVQLVLPGHRRIFKDCKERIRELKHHHQVRTEEVLSILLEQGRMDAYQVASRMSWEIAYDSWDLFPATQKWFATGEAIAHLKYLEEKGMIQREVQEQKIVFSLR